MAKKSSRPRVKGFTLIELLLVLTIIGLMMTLIIPRAMRARTDSNYNLIRQYGSEIAGYITSWAQTQARSQRPGTSFTLKDFLYDDMIESDNAGLVSNKLVNKYTGNKDFDGVASLIAADKMPRNPFNQTGYFSPPNDDRVIPSRKAGLMYLAVQPDPRQEEYLNFYLLFTSQVPNDQGSFWYGDMDHNDGDKIRRGVFVARLYNDQEYGGGETEYLMSPPGE